MQDQQQTGNLFAITLPQSSVHIGTLDHRRHPQRERPDEHNRSV